MPKTYLKTFFVWLFLLSTLLPLHAQALVKMDTNAVNYALKYGIQNQGLGYSTLLGPNWIEGQDGTLLNIYSPFMLLASKAYKGSFSKEATDADLKKARKQYQRYITQMTDPKVIQEVKFSTAVYGDSEDFALKYTAWIEGFGRGKDFVLKPIRQIRQRLAIENPEANNHPFEAVNAFYFKFNDVEVLEDYQFVIQDGITGKQTRFKLKNSRLY